MAFRRRSLVLTGAAISVVALGILTNLATNFMPEDALPPPWLIWAALIIVALIFSSFSFSRDRISSLRRMFFSRRLILCIFSHFPKTFAVYNRCLSIS